MPITASKGNQTCSGEDPDQEYMFFIASEMCLTLRCILLTHIRIPSIGYKNNNLRFGTEMYECKTSVFKTFDEAFENQLV